MMKLAYSALLCAALTAGGCGGDNGYTPGPPDGALSSAPDAATTPDAAATPCPGVGPICTAWNEVSTCVQGANGQQTWVAMSCPDGCFDGQCTAAACADECRLGQTDPTKGTCKLWDMSSQKFITVDPAGNMHDRARDYDRILHSLDLPEGQVVNAHYTDASRSTLSLYTGTGDAAIWTGSYLASQAWRYMVTRGPNAAAQIKALVQTLHRDYNVSGDPGYLARMTVPASSTVPLEHGTYSTYCDAPNWHCGVSYNGGSYNWLGHSSRDAYTGVMLGYYLAYRATTDPAVKKMIRDDVVAMVKELMKQRKNVPVAVVVDGVPLSKTINIENVILAPSEMVNGKVQITIDSSNPTGAGIHGMREFLPDFGTLVDQLLGISVTIHRASTTIMLGAFFNMALEMTDGVPGYETVHKQIADYYAAHADQWLTISQGWTFSDTNCGSSYYANHIAFIMAYVWAMAEKNPALVPRIRDDVLDGQMWQALKGHKNSYFAYLWGGTRVTPPTTEIDAANAQLKQFEPGPRIHAARDLTSDPAYMPHSTSCTNQCDHSLAVDVGDRMVSDFMWQRQPWGLLDNGDPTTVFPGVDYLAAYWAARYHNFLQDDHAGTCARWSK